MIRKKIRITGEKLKASKRKELDATEHEMSSQANIDRLNRGIQQLKEGNVIYKELKDLF